MVKDHIKNKDSEALVERSEINVNLAKHDLEEWTFGYCNLRPGMRVLDMGCGWGKQVFHLVDKLDGDVHVTAIDASAESLKTLESKAREKGFENVRTMQMDFDDFEVLPDVEFDLIVSSYAFYYATDMVALTAKLRENLAPGGGMFICGFGEGTNRELTEVADECGGGDDVMRIGDFMSQEQLDELSKLFVSCEVFRLSNSIAFQDAAVTMNWWRNHSSYIERIDACVEEKVAAIVDQNGSFPMSKEVMGVRLSL